MFKTDPNYMTKEMIEEILSGIKEDFSDEGVSEDNIVWKAQPGSQQYFLTCPAFECLNSGTRGSGKSDGLIMDYLRDVGVGWGASWKGILFRKTYKQLEDIVTKCFKWIPRVFPGSSFNKSDLSWSFKDSERLLLRYMDTEKDYWNYHGHEYPWIGWEELSNWATIGCYEAMISCCRSSESKEINGKKMPRRIRSDTNPFGAGHGWIKAYFIDQGKELEIVGSGSETKTWISGHMLENKALMDADPGYIKNIAKITDPNKRKAWLEGSWDIVAGGVISDLWTPSKHILKPFKIPPEWKVNRSFDWGSSKPFSVGWWAMSDGSEVEIEPDVFKFFPKGSLIRIDEWYGWTGDPDVGLNMPPTEIAKKIKLKEMSNKLLRDLDIRPGPADSSIFNSDAGSLNIAKKMLRWKEGAGYSRGIKWTRSNRRPGSRIIGLQLFRDMLAETLVENPEQPCFYVFDTCTEGFLRTVPSLPRSEKDPDDANTDVEDHCYDDVRYRVLDRLITVTTQEV